MKDIPTIEIRELNKTFGTAENQVVALDNINISICRGEIFGIIGLSGAGKSTLVRCINLLERPTTGSVIFEGVDITNFTDQELRKVRQSIGMIFQSFNLLMQRTAMDNICFPLEIAGVSRKRLYKGLVSCGDCRISREGECLSAQLSGGQKQGWL